MSDYPLVSVLMTAFNRERYIVEAIESVRESLYTNWELIITDDCSTDSSLQIARGYAAHDERIRVYKNEVNLGDYANRNRAASYANGKYLMHVDSDDKLLGETMKQCVELFENHLDVSFGIYSPVGHKEPYRLKSAVAINKHFFEEPFLLMGPGGTFIRNEYFKKINGFSAKYGPASDGYFNLKATSFSDIFILTFPLIYYRRHEGQEVNNKFSYLYNSYLYLRDALEEIELPVTQKQKEFLQNKNRRRFLVNVSKFAFQKRNLKKTIEAIDKAEFTITDLFKGIFH